MKKIKFNAYFSSSWVNANASTELEIEVEDDATEEEIEAAKDYATEQWAANIYDVSHD